MAQRVCGLTLGIEGRERRSCWSPGGGLVGGQFQVDNAMGFKEVECLATRLGWWSSKVSKVMVSV